MNYFLIITCILFPSFLKATLLKPLSIEEHLTNSSAVIHGHYKEKLGSKKDSTTGFIFTEHSLDLIATAGLNEREIPDHKFVTHGGEYEGITQEIEGSPTFNKGEEVVLLLRKTRSGYVVNNLSLGKYEVTSRDGRKILVNSAFPGNDTLSNISLDQFNGYVQGRFGHELAEIKKTVFHHSNSTDKSEIKKEKSSRESPSSTHETQERELASFSSKSPVLILVAISVVLGLLFYWRRKQRS